MKKIHDFIFKLDSDFWLNSKLIIIKRNRYYLFNAELKPYLFRDFYHAGIYLGKTKHHRFFPSFSLLAMMAKVKANKIKVDRKSEWLFTCGRDIFKQGVTGFSKSLKKGQFTLVLNNLGECLGLGKLTCNLETETNSTKVVVKNISDIGDFLRRER